MHDVSMLLAEMRFIILSNHFNLNWRHVGELRVSVLSAVGNHEIPNLRSSDHANCWFSPFCPRSVSRNVLVNSKSTHSLSQSTFLWLKWLLPLFIIHQHKINILYFLSFSISSFQSSSILKSTYQILANCKFWNILKCIFRKINFFLNKKRESELEKNT